MIESTQLNILIETGTDFVLPFVIKDDEGHTVDLTGATVSAQLREYAEAVDSINFICTHNNEGGKITITMPHENTSQITYSYGVYDVKLTPAVGGISYPLHGNVSIREGVTKSPNGSVLFLIGIDDYDDLPLAGNTDRLYFCNEDRKIYRWNGSNYIATSVGNGIQNITYLDGGTYRMVFDDGTYFDFNSVPRVMGTYSSTTAYQKLDIVHGTDGATYIAKIQVPVGTALSNATYWQQMTPKVFTQVNVTTVGANQDASASIGGTGDSPQLNLSIPRGAAGNESIDDTKGESYTDYVWSADKSWHEIEQINANIFGICNMSALGTVSVNLSSMMWEPGRINNSGQTSTTKGYRTSDLLKFSQSILYFIDESSNEYSCYLSKYNPTTKEWVANIGININGARSIDNTYLYRIVCYVSDQEYPDITGLKLVYNMPAIKELSENIIKDNYTIKYDYADYGIEQGLISSTGNLWNRKGYRTVDYVTFPTKKIIVNDSGHQANCEIWLYRFEKNTHNFVSGIINYSNLSNRQIEVDLQYDYKICFLNVSDSTVYPNPDTLTFTYIKSSEITGAILQPTATWIDDNQGTNAQMTALSSLLDELTDTNGNRMKITLAVGCEMFSESYGNDYKNNLKLFEEAGCHIANHGNTWQDWIDHWDTDSNYDPDICEKAIIKGNRLLSEYGFLETNYFIYPGGHTNNELCKRVKKWCNVGVLAGNSNGICHLTGNGRFRLNRCFIRALDGETLAEAETRIKGYIDTAYANNDWIIFGTHSGNTANEFNHDLCVTIIQYAQTKGFTFKTLNEAYKERELLFKLSEV